MYDRICLSCGAVQPAHVAQNPLVVGVDVKEGILRLHTPICVPSKDNLLLGKVTSIEKDHKALFELKRGGRAAIKITPSQANSHLAYGKHFDWQDDLVSLISRKSIDILKTHFRSDLTKEEWKLVVKLKKLFKIV